MNALGKDKRIFPLLSSFAGLNLILLYCLFATGADAITRSFAQSFEAAQLFFFSGGLVAFFSFLTHRLNSKSYTFKTKRPLGLVIRSGLFILSALFYYSAFRALPFAEVFVFIACVPIFAAVLSGPILKEPVRWQGWLALFAGAGGMLLLYPNGLADLTAAHLSAFLAALFGAASMVMARHISRDEPNALLQVLYPNLALCAAMALVLPFIYKPMQLVDVAMVIGYASLLFLARWVLILALSRLKAHVVTLLLNFQFIFMIIVGIAVFAEPAPATLILGVAIIMLAGAYLLLEERMNTPAPQLAPKLT